MICTTKSHFTIADKKTYQYHFTQRPPFAQYEDWIGADHSHELFYQFDDDKAKAIMTKYPDIDLTNVIHIFPFLLKAYPEDIKDKSNLQKADSSNQAYTGLTHAMKDVDGGKFVPDFGYRYFTEDIPYGLAVLRGISEVVGVPTPLTDKVLAWAQARMGKVYLEDGKIKGKDVASTRAPQRYGFVAIDAMLGK